MTRPDVQRCNSDTILTIYKLILKPFHINGENRISGQAEIKPKISVWPENLSKILFSKFEDGALFCRHSGEHTLDRVDSRQWSLDWQPLEIGHFLRAK